MKKYLFLLVVIGLTSPLSVVGAAPVKIIFDTDMSSDCDDAGALALLHGLADRGEAEILATIVNGIDKDQCSAATVVAINRYYRRGSIPVGCGRFGYKEKSSFTSHIRMAFAKDVPTDDKQPPATSVYRRVLARQPDRSVTIVSVGFVHNLADLLKTRPDAHSSLDGAGLARKKVKQLVVMGGNFPKGKGEFNLMHNIREAQAVVAKWPTPIVFAPGKLGEKIITGFALKDAAEANPVRAVYQRFTPLWMPLDKRWNNAIKHGNPSWDQTAVLYAVRGAEPCFERSKRGKVTIQMAPRGTEDRSITQWKDDPKSRHSYLKEKMPLRKVAAIIDKLMAAPPRGTGPGG